MKSSPLSGGRLLARNSLLSLLGQCVPLAVAIVTMPLLVSGLGPDRFGVLAISWMIIGYFTFFDLGLSRAATKFIAETLGRGEHAKFSPLFWTSLCMNLVLGTTAGIVLIASTPVLSSKVFSTSGGMLEEGRSIFYILSAALPALLASTMLRGVLEAGQRFDLINAVQMTAGSLLFVLPLCGLSIGLGLPGIVLLLVVARLAVTVVYFIMCCRVFRVLPGPVHIDPSLIRPLFSFGGLMSVAAILSTAILSVDRLMISSLVSTAAVTYYSAPYEVLIRLMVFPSSIIIVLFPTFSAIGMSSRKSVARIYARSIKYLLVVMGPILLLFILFAGDILRLWLGAEYGVRSSGVLRILAVGMMLTPFQVSQSLIQGAGRPDITAKFYLAELALYVPLVVFMAKSFGIEGVAVAWTLRAGLDTVLILAASVRLFGIRLNAMVDNGLISGIFAVILLASIFFLILISGLPLHVRVLTSSVSVAAFMAASWRYVMDSQDREVLCFWR